ncbi:MAG: class I SAM-dependent methyltransferase [Halobacteriaceae archaeon]
MGTGTSPLRLGTRDEGAEFSFETRPDVRSPDAFHPAELAVLEHLVETDPERALVLGETYGAIGIPLSTVASRVAMAAWRARSRNLCERNCRRNAVEADVHLVASPTAVPNTFDVVGYAPRAYTPTEVAAQRVLDALTRLEDGATLLLAARDEDGGAAQARLLADHLTVEDLTTTNGVPVRRITKPAGYEAPTVVESTSFPVTVEDTQLTLVSKPGLFAADELDPGTRLLMESLEPIPEDRVLDLAGGYGPVAAYAAAHGCSTVLTEDSRPATACAEATLAANDLDAAVHTADALSAVRGETFDLVATNPPTHEGGRVLDDLLGDLDAVLAPGGRVRIVHHESLDLTRHFDDRLTTPTVVAEGAEHVVIGARAPT